MQPNEQNQNQNPYQVPGYLQLNPVTGQPAQPNKKPLIIGIVALLVLIVIGASVVYVEWLQGAPERQFYTALDDMMQVNGITRTFTVTTSSANLMADITSDFSTAATPKSQLSYTYTQTNQQTTTSQKADEVITAPGVFYARLLKAPTSSSQYPPLQQWQQVAVSDKKLAGVYDPLQLHMYLNTFDGEVLIGNFSQNNRQQLLDFIKTHAVYTIIGHQQATVNGKQATEYAVSISEKALVDLNNKAAALLGVLPAYDVSTDSPSAKTYTFIVDDTTGRLVRMSYATKVTTGVGAVSGSFDFAYPAQVTVTAPQV